MTETAFRKLKEENDNAKSAAERAQGSFDQSMKNLVEEFGVEGLAEAKEKLKRDAKATDQAQTDFEKCLAAYKKKWESE
jgi:hypothetical protein